MDILVGWHIDIQQDPVLIDYIASALISLHEFWVKDMMFSVDLLKQFLEDMEAYSNVSVEGGEKGREGGREIHTVYMYMNIPPMQFLVKYFANQISNK